MQKQPSLQSCKRRVVQYVTVHSYIDLAQCSDFTREVKDCLQHAKCITRTHLLRQLQVLPLWDKTCRSSSISHPSRAYWLGPTSPSTDRKTAVKGSISKLDGQSLDTITGSDRKFDQQLLCQPGSTCHYLPRTIPEIHFVCCWDFFDFRGRNCFSHIGLYSHKWCCNSQTDRTPRMYSHDQTWSMETYISN